MTDDPLIHELKVEAGNQGRDHKTRMILVIVGAMWLITLGVLGAVTWNAYFDEKEKSQTLAQQVSLACKSGDLAASDQQELCEDAEAVIKDEDPEGITGPEGPRGVQGIQGVSGPEGPIGNPGPRGPKGNRGEGEVGSPGSDGSPGRAGTDGNTGPVGPEGPRGPEGAEGPAGPEGAQGPTGLVGIQFVGCEGPIITSVSGSYDAASQMIVITCT